jgi:DnaJ-class molecular chaperone
VRSYPGMTFGDMWLEIGIVHDWKRRPQQALAALSTAYRRDACGIRVHYKTPAKICEACEGSGYVDSEHPCYGGWDCSTCDGKGWVVDERLGISGVPRGMEGR